MLEGRDGHLMQQCASAEGRADALQQKTSALEQQLAATTGLLTQKARPPATHLDLLTTTRSRVEGDHIITTFITLCHPF